MSKRKASMDAATYSGVVSRKAKLEEEESSLEEMSDEELDMSQRPNFKSIQDPGVGIIEQISLKNFMSHNRLSVKFGPNVNFIIGSNGSGKSAVPTALVVGMGGKATATCRGSTVKTFVKTGKQSADVEIKLRNRGSDAYKPELYGDSIIIQRRFTSDGTSQYKLKSKKGKVVSQKRDELSRILDQFNIQVDNPVSILNQDTSRNFLHSKSPNDKYKFFLKATQLEQIKKDYTKANEQKEVTQGIIEQKTKTLPVLQNDVLAWERKYKALTALEDLKKKIRRLKFEMAWSFVIEKEKGLTPLERELHHEESRLPRFIQKAEEAKAKVETLNNQYKDVSSQLKIFGEEAKQLQPQHALAKDELTEQKKVTRNAQMEVRRLDGTISNMTKERDSILERIRELQTSAQHDNDSERRAREEKITSLQEKLDSIQAQENTTEHQLDQFRNAVTRYKSDEYKLGQDIQRLRHRLEKLQRYQQDLKNSVGNQLKRFGDFIPQLTQHIEEYNRLGKFHKKPIGPLGGYFQLVDQKWTLAVECCLKSLMNAFCCHDHHDEKILEQIMSNVCPPQYKPTIVVSSFRDSVYNVSRFRAEKGQYPSVFDVIQSDHPMVVNTLIDQRSIECVILIEDGRVAREVMDPDRRPGPPRNCSEAFTLTGDQVYSRPSLRYYSSMQDKVRYLTSNVEEDIAKIAREIQEITDTLNISQQQKNQMNTDIKQNLKEERQAESQLMKIREAKSKYTMEITELKNIEDPAPVDVTTLEEEVAMLNEQLGTQQQQRNAKNEVYEEQQGRLNAVDKNFKEIEGQLKAKVEACEPLKEELGKLLDEVESSKGHKKHYDQKLKELEKELAKMKTKVEKYQQEIEADIEKASAIHKERINTRRTSQSIENEINQINKQIKSEEKLRGDPEEVTRKYKEMKDAYFAIKKEVSQLRMFCDQLDNVVGDRLRQYTEFRRRIAVRTKHFFIVLLSNRQYTGKLYFNHQKESLELSVQPATVREETQGAKDMRSLSGGEKSFSTVCFILALWDAIESPFRCLDEFDIYMDMVNRRISMDMMMETARTQTDKQFIFLTPLDMSRLGINTSNVRIFRMPEPDRGQEVLPFEPSSQQEEEDETQ